MIRRISALNYKCLRYVDQPVGPFQVLVGPNASGKSAFLDVVRLVSDLLDYDLEWAVLLDPDLPTPGRARRVEELVFNQVADHFEIAVDLHLPERLTGDWANGKEAFVRYEAAIGTDGEGGELRLLVENLWRCTARGPDRLAQPTLFPVEPAPPPSIITRRKPSGWRRLLAKVPEGNDYFYPENSQYHPAPLRFGHRRSALIHVPEDESKFPVALWARDALRTGVMHLALDIDAMRCPVSPSEARGFLPTGGNLPLVIRELRAADKRRFRDWLRHVQTVLPDVADIEVVERPEDRYTYLLVKYGTGGEGVPSWLLSDGTLRFLALTVIPYLDLEPAVFLVEEPENGIHPRAIEAVFDALSSVYHGHVSVATHSPLVVSLAARKPEQILCFARNPSGATAIVSGDRHPALRDWQGQPDLSVLYAAGVLS
jgi:predicted ATPase